ncbi:hypothetical protein FB561_2761 [Kribbella amoyensis]|uniref:Uncharacterized protein n=1 Tax=Kribbella amoyensis TaxID=996641 RepID=A0A561BRY2_9ACTN|nr:hypothetical protein [Kribbella amoyensis]TWD81641.1 hypothetical protein FB561_2761 [Kribbella amoyensis]
MDAELTNELRQLRHTVDSLRQAIESATASTLRRKVVVVRAADEGREVDPEPAALFDPLIAWANVSAQLTGRIKELALFERGDREVGGALRPDEPFAALLETVQATRQARLEVARAYQSAGRELPAELLADIPPDWP